MDEVTRRSLLQGTGAAVAAVGLVQEAVAQTKAFGPTDPYDLVVRGGEVVDPSQNLRGRRDVGIRNALIAAVEPEIPPARGTQVLDASGQLVLPGLVDFHATSSRPWACRAPASASRATSWCPSPAPRPM